MGSPLASYGVIADGSGMHWAVQYAGFPSALATSGPTSGWYLLEAYFARTASDVTLNLSVNEAQVTTLNWAASTTPVNSGWFGQVYYTGTNALTINIDNAAIDADQNNLYELTTNVVGNGQVNRNPNQQFYLEGTEVELTAVADPGWTFSGWSGAATGTDPTTTITIGDGDSTVTATFIEVIENEDATLLFAEKTTGFMCATITRTPMYGVSGRFYLVE